MKINFVAPTLFLSNGARLALSLSLSARCWPASRTQCKPRSERQSSAQIELLNFTRTLTHCEWPQAQLFACQRNAHSAFCLQLLEKCSSLGQTVFPLSPSNSIISSGITRENYFPRLHFAPWGRKFEENSTRIESSPTDLEHAGPLSPIGAPRWPTEKNN